MLHRIFRNLFIQPFYGDQKLSIRNESGFLKTNINRADRISNGFSFLQFSISYKFHTDLAFFITPPKH